MQLGGVQQQLTTLESSTRELKEKEESIAATIKDVDVAKVEALLSDYREASILKGVDNQAPHLFSVHIPA